MNRTVLITGVNGFLGSHLAEYWIGKQYQIIALTSTEADPGLPSSIIDNVVWYSYDQGMEKPFLENNIDVVVHTAGIYGRKGEDAAYLVEVNVCLGLKLLQETLKAGVVKFVNAGTSLPSGTSEYALSKAQFVSWLKKSAGHGCSIINVMIEQMYGPRDDESKFITWLIGNMLRGVPGLDLTAGEQKRDFIYIDDIVSAFDIIIHADFESQFCELGLGSGRAVPVRKVVERVKDLCGSDTDLNFGKISVRANEPGCLQADIEILSGLGWACRTSLEDGLAITVDSVRP